MRWAWLMKGSAIHCDLDIWTKVKSSDWFCKKHKLLDEIASFISIETVLLKIIVPLVWKNAVNLWKMQSTLQRLQVGIDNSLHKSAVYYVLPSWLDLHFYFMSLLFCFCRWLLLAPHSPWKESCSTQSGWRCDARDRSFWHNCQLNVSVAVCSRWCQEQRTESILGSCWTCCLSQPVRLLGLIAGFWP